MLSDRDYAHKLTKWPPHHRRQTRYDDQDEVLFLKLVGILLALAFGIWAILNIFVPIGEAMMDAITNSVG